MSQMCKLWPLQICDKWPKLIMCHYTQSCDLWSLTPDLYSISMSQIRDQCLEVTNLWLGVSDLCSIANVTMCNFWPLQICDRWPKSIVVTWVMCHCTQSCDLLDLWPVVITCYMCSITMSQICDMWSMWIYDVSPETESHKSVTHDFGWNKSILYDM